LKLKKTAIVTGGLGFIGSHMVDLLLSKNFKVYILDNLSGGRIENINHHKNNSNLSLLKKDICKLDGSSKIFKNADYVFHFAGLGDIVPSIENPEKYFLNNAYGTLKLMEQLKNSKIKKIVYAASSSCYGLSAKNVSENSKINLLHPYAFSKYTGEKIILNWNKVYGIPANSIRIFNAYGLRVRTTGAYGAVFGVFLKQKLANKPLTIVGDGDQTRDFVHVSDVTKAFLRAAETKISGEYFNLGSGKEIKINYLAKLIGGKKVNLPDRPGEPRYSRANISKIKKRLKWYPKKKFEDGVKEMLKNIDYWKEAPLWSKEKIQGATKKWFKAFK